MLRTLLRPKLLSSLHNFMFRKFITIVSLNPFLLFSKLWFLVSERLWNLSFNKFPIISIFNSFYRLRKRSFLIWLYLPSPTFPRLACRTLLFSWWPLHFLHISFIYIILYYILHYTEWYPLLIFTYVPYDAVNNPRPIYCNQVSDCLIFFTSLTVFQMEIQHTRNGVNANYSDRCSSSSVSLPEIQMFVRKP